MSGDAWLVLAVLVGVVVAMATDRLSTVTAMGGGLAVLLVTGAIDDDVALSGLSSPATATIAALYVVAAAVTTTGAMTWLIDRVLFGGRGGLVRLAGSTAAMSAFVPNTPLVALAAPRAVRWSRGSGQSASRLLMPLSFASVLGGVITLLGTSTNLVVSDVLRATGEDELGVFEVTPVGLPVAVVGVVVLVLVAPRLLRHRTAAGESMRDSARRFQIQMLVQPGGPLAGATIEQAGLRDLDGLFLAAVERGDQLVAANPDRRLVAGDRLYFVGDVQRIVDLQDTTGLTSAEQNHLIEAEGPGVRLFEAVVGGRSVLAGQTLKDAGFRGRYGAAVLAVHRADGDLRGKLGTIPIQVGDVLLVLAGPDFAERWREHGDFALVASVADPPPPRRRRAGLAAGSFLGMIVLAATGALSLFAASAVAAAAVVFGGNLSLTEARRAVDLNVVLTIAASISLGAAVETTGLAASIADRLVDVGAPLGAAGLLVIVIVATQLLTEVLSNSGAAALMVPVAMAAAVGVDGDPRTFAIGVLIGASCSFLTPIGYQTNLMVYGLGGYRFFDFTLVGLPLTIASAAVASVMLTLLG
jgi:di/tricarboxylate transporter